MLFSSLVRALGFQLILYGIGFAANTPVADYELDSINNNPSTSPNQTHERESASTPILDYDAENATSNNDAIANSSSLNVSVNEIVPEIPQESVSSLLSSQEADFQHAVPVVTENSGASVAANRVPNASVLVKRKFVIDLYE
ncbi:MAG: hypothetical protein NTX76_04425 [Alphaproteobacteria bacterium]|nr:hypothetical protein [Alphaproteobacteria bacterium]